MTTTALVKRILLVSLALNVLTISLVESIICNGTTSCLHDGQFNMNNCSCSCGPAYSGSFCQYVNCSSSAQPADCSTYPTSICSSPSMASYCPLLCNSSACVSRVSGCRIDSCLNGGTLNTTTCTCQCSSIYFGAVCQKVCSNNSTCLNGGTWNWTACACNCPSGYYGPTCASSTATACATTDPTSCYSTYSGSCSSKAIQSYCPNVCGLCGSSTSSSTRSTTSYSSTSSYSSSSTTSYSTSSTSSYSSSSTTSGCTTLTCAYGITFNSGTCSCPCDSGFYGTTCASFNCSSGVTDYSTDCSTSANCSDPTNILFCPYTCFNCASSCSLTSSDCDYQQPLNSTSCTCTCNTGFYGADCSSFNCTSGATDISTDCPTMADCSQDLYILYCPQTCFNCTTTGRQLDILDNLKGAKSEKAIAKLLADKLAEKKSSHARLVELINQASRRDGLGLSLPLPDDILNTGV